ncbi:MAG: hypothetical protein KatS3mg035_2018 [Bacteroidia bacterium]|nr:MAG: hypothetical protein KatS3mg035_2018 [Bacteroidia bacterium]
MIIANPIYDVVFKRMMENERVAKFFIGTLLEEEIEKVEVKPQEFTYVDELAGLAVFRLDFIATIKTEKGESKKVLIEIQKARNYIDLMRFRNYLAEQYKKEDYIDNEKQILPITTIYILGFTIPEIDSACIKVERNYKDLIEKRIIEKKSEFVEKFTHDSYIVQVERITSRYQTKLDKLLSLFEQSYFIGDSKIIKEYPYPIDNEDIKLTAEILHYSGTNPGERKLIEMEQEAWRSVNAMFEDKEKKYIKALEETRKELEEEKKRAEEEKKRAEEEHLKLIETAKFLKSLNIDIQIIANKTGLSLQEIEKL